MFRALLLRKSPAMHFRFLFGLCVLSVAAFAQNKPTDKSLIAEPQRTAPKGKPQPMEHHSTSSWHYHKGPKRNAIPGDSTGKPAPSQQPNTPDAGK
jgi:hypothetical protein